MGLPSKRCLFISVLLLSSIPALPAMGAVLSGSKTSQPASVNLATEGAADWSHWGLNASTDWNHKGGITAQISNVVKVGTGTISRYTDGTCANSWTGGTPTASVTNTKSGIYVAGAGNGFQITAPADTTVRTLRVYCGVWKSQGRLEAALSDSSAPALVDTSHGFTGGSSNVVFSIQYAAASSGQNLTLKWTVQTSHDTSGNGTVGWQAATLVTSSTSNPPPSVSLTAPANGNSYLAPANIAMSAAASDSNGSISRVEFLNGTTLISTDTSSPYSVTWNNVGVGTYNLSARATDDGGISSTSSTAVVTVKSTSSNNPPSVSLTSPANGAQFIAPATITLQALSADSDGSVTKVEFFSGTSLLGSDTSSPFSIQWNSVGVGNYSLAATATDNGGSATTSTSVQISVVSGGNNIPPKVYMISPAPGATYVAPATIQLKAVGVDEDGTIQNINFYSGSTLISTDTSSPYSFTWTGVGAGRHVLSAQATDSGGGVAATSPSAVIVSTGTGTSEDLRIKLLGALVTPTGAKKDLELDFTSRSGIWENEIWGYSPTFNKGEHSGRLLDWTSSTGTLNLKIQMDIDGDRWVPGGNGSYQMDLNISGANVTGTYAGSFNATNPVSGSVTGTIQPRLLPSSSFAALAQGEHPRMLFRKSELAALKSKASTTAGQQIINYLKASVGGTCDAECEVIKALGNALLWQITGTTSYADRAIQLIDAHTLDTQGAFVRGPAIKCLYVAMAYDLVYDYCTQAFRDKINSRLRQNSISLYYGAERNGFNPTDGSNWQGSYRSAYLAWALTLLKEKSVYPAQPPLPVMKAVPPPANFVPGSGVPVVTLASDQMPVKWIWVGPWTRQNDEDCLSALGGVANARPDLGTSVTYRGVTRTFNTNNPSCIWKDAGWTDSKNTLDLPCEINHQLFTASYHYTVVQNNTAGWYEVRIEHRDPGDGKITRPERGRSHLYLAGQKLADGDSVYLSAGRYPLMIDSELGYTPPWGKIIIEPRFIATTEAAAKSQHQTRTQDYYYRLSLWQEGFDLWSTDGNQDPNARRMLKIGGRSVGRFITIGLGDHGWGTEGEGYYGETLNQVLPVSHGYRRAMGLDVARPFNLEWVLPMYTARTIFPSLDIPRIGIGDGAIAGRSSLYSQGFGLVPDSLKPGVLWDWNSVTKLGTSTTGDLGGINGACFALVNYPSGLTAQIPSAVMSRAIQDLQKGGYVFRREWKDANDLMCQVFLKSQPLRSLWQAPDAGIFRIYGFGTHFANRGSNWPKEGDRKQENVVQLPDNPINGKLGAKTTYFASRSNGSAILSMDMNDVLLGYASTDTSIVDYDGRIMYEKTMDLGIRGMRSIAADYSGASGTPGLFAIVDKYSGGGAKIWQMHTAGTVSVSGNTFKITGANGATLNARVASPGTPAITVTADTAGRFIRITGGSEYFVVMTVQNTTPPAMSVSGTGLAAKVTVGSQTISFDGQKIVLTSF